jgi:hypothetical protein
MNDIEAKKDKIEKLLKLALSDNEHEAKAALDKAIELMEKYNITQEDIYKQNIIHKVIELDSYVIRDDIIWLGTKLGHISGLYTLYSQGSKKRNKKARFHITGRELDILNFEYILSIILFHLKSESNKKKMELRKKLKSSIYSKNTNELYSFRKGLISGFLNKLKKQKEDFFKSYTNENKLGLMVIPSNENKITEGENYFKNNFDCSITETVHTSNINSNYYSSGYKTGEDISISKPLQNKEQNILLIGENK